VTGGSLRIDYWVINGGSVQIRVYGLSGQTARHLYKASLPIGAFTTNWDGKDDKGQPVASGLYMVVITEPNRMEIKKVAVVKE
jgi:flagellar hook assembly protein FlgD